MLLFNVFWILVRTVPYNFPLSVRLQNGPYMSSSQILTIWGLIGVHTDKFGFKHVWEIWYELGSVTQSHLLIYGV